MDKSFSSKHEDKQSIRKTFGKLLIQLIYLVTHSFHLLFLLELHQLQPNLTVPTPQGDFQPGYIVKA